MTVHRLALLIAASVLNQVAWATDPMPVAQQNFLVQKYCAACHDDKKMIADFSLQHYDAANADPGLTAMLVSKMNGGAFGAAGIPIPAKPVEHALLNALSEKAIGAETWNTFTRTPITTLGIVQKASSLYRLTLTCNADTHEGEIRVAWSPNDVPGTGASMAVTVDGRAPSAYNVANGEGRAILLKKRLPDQTLTISNLFPGETVTFPFAGLTSTMRQSVSPCFSQER